MLCCVALCSVVLCCAVLCCVVLCCAVCQEASNGAQCYHLSSSLGDAPTAADAITSSTKSPTSTPLVHCRQMMQLDGSVRVRALGCRILISVGV